MSPSVGYRPRQKTRTRKKDMDQSWNKRHGQGPGRKKHVDQEKEQTAGKICSFLCLTRTRTKDMEQNRNKRHEQGPGRKKHMDHRKSRTGTKDMEKDKDIDHDKNMC